MNIVNFKKKSNYFLIIAIFLLVGCGGTTNNNQSEDNYPIISFYDDLNYTVEINHNFEYPKAYAQDPEDGNLTNKIEIIDNIDYNKTGSYELIYKVTDSRSHTTTKTKIVNIIPPQEIDQTPTIKLIGPSTVLIGVGKKYTELGAKAEDKEDGDISDQIEILSNLNNSKTGSYTIKYEVSDTYGHHISTIRNIIVVKNSSYSFDDIRDIIKKAKDNKISDATYICVGDSTRAISEKYHAQYYFEKMQKELDKYNVKSILFARVGFQAKQLNESSVKGMRISDLINEIPGDGENSIVDISLGINDGWEGNIQNLKTYLTNTIYQVYRSKPNTKFMLTTPSRIRSESATTNYLKKIYHELSSELNIPLNSVVEEFMPDSNNVDLSLYRRIDSNKYDNVHLSQKGLYLIADYVLLNILPK